jgi:hypothetical protein
VIPVVSEPVNGVEAEVGRERGRMVRVVVRVRRVVRGSIVVMVRC